MKPFTIQEYEAALSGLMQGLTQMRPDGRECAICGDGDHQAQECPQNPLMLIRRGKRGEHEFRCYHCGVVCTTKKEADAHFGKQGSVRHRRELRPVCREMLRIAQKMVDGNKRGK